jgi:hypothetical protein
MMDRPRRFFSAPDVAPRVVWDCHQLAVISQVVAPPSDRSISIVPAFRYFLIVLRDRPVYS